MVFTYSLRSLWCFWNVSSLISFTGLPRKSSDTRFVLASRILPSRRWILLLDIDLWKWKKKWITNTPVGNKYFYKFSFDTLTPYSRKKILTRNGIELCTRTNLHSTGNTSERNCLVFVTDGAWAGVEKGN